MVRKMNSMSLIIMLGLLCVIAGCGSGLSTKTKVCYLSGQGKDDAVEWEFYCTAGRNSGSWETIPVPSNWELQGFGSYNYGRQRSKSSEQGKYRTHFDVPQSWADNRIFIVFDGVMTDTQVMVNGKSAGPVHQGGFYRFRYEITELVKAGDNLLEATVSKVSSDRSVEQAERMADYWVFGGIFRPVYLEVVPKEFIEWTAVDAKADGTFSIDVHLNVSGIADTVRAQITELDGTGIGVPFETKLEKGQEKAILKTRVGNPTLWTAETPNLYQVTVTLLSGSEEIHSATERFGFRTFEVRAGDGLYLNGQKIRLKGVNRHSFWPDSGRCLSRKISYDDVRLIKQMNMNSVRMSHYPPDAHFLDACDELGLYVLDELAGWQRPPYDTEVGVKLVKEMLTRDVSHPSILFWDNGNEGGWNRDLDGEFDLYDPQKRVVLHPWDNFNNIDTDHYENYASLTRKLSGSNLFMPTELLHGLYDGGHGAGLKDYWDLMYSSPLGAGIFLWVLTDEGVVRMDKDGAIDVAGNQAPDGIVGPYREKEGSFYTIKEIWSPVQIFAEQLPDNFDGRLKIENRYDFTNLMDCAFEVKLCRFPGPQDESTQTYITFTKSFNGPDIKPHGSGTVALPLPENWRDADVLYLKALDPHGDEVWTWSWDIHSADFYRQKLARSKSDDSSRATVDISGDSVRVQAGDLVVAFDNKTGDLAGATVNGKKISLANGPKLLGGSQKKTKLSVSQIDNSISVKIEYDGEMNYVNWLVHPTGWIELEYEFEIEGQFNLFGVNFDYPENMMNGMQWLGRGPYRVWKNRTKGGQFGLWSNNYKDNIPGVTWDYPEFKGYYCDWRWIVFSSEEGDITMVNGTEDLYLGVYRPNDGPEPMNTKLDVPDTGIALLNGIPPIGTKFLKAEELGPESQKNRAGGKYKGKVYLHFRN